MNHQPLRPIKGTLQNFWLNRFDVRIPYGVGCAWLGKGYPDRNEVKDRLLTLETAYESGFRYFDSARAYGDSERVVGEFVATIPRESIFLATKFNLPKVKSPFTAVDQVRKFLDESLQRLQTSYVDLYQIHDSTKMELVFAQGGVLEFLLEAKRQGLIRNIGMAIRDQSILERALEHDAFDTILTWGDYSPFNQNAAKLIDRAAHQQVGVINASPLFVARRRGLDLGDPSVLAAVLQFPMTNPGIDMTLSGPSNRKEILATVHALHMNVDRGLWEAWKELGDLR